MKADGMVLGASAWLLTYVVHSTVLLAAVLFATRSRAVASPRLAEPWLRAALFGPLITASVHIAGGPSWTFMLTAGAAGPPPGRAGDVPGAGLESAVVAVWSGVAPLISPLLFPLFGVCLVFGVLRVLAFVRARRALLGGLGQRVPAETGVQSVARALAGRWPLRVTVSERAAVPMIIGAHEICLPSRAVRELSPAELRSVLAHEVAHLRRRDDLWLGATMLLERLFWLQPLNAIAAARLRALAECACDDWALRRTGQPVALASALVRAAGWIGAGARARYSIGMAERRSLALVRVVRILDAPAPSRRSSGRLPTVLAGTVVVAMALLAPGFSATPADAASSSPPSDRYTITAHDPAGPFTLTLESGRVVGMTIDGEPVDPARLERERDRLRVHDAHGGIELDLTLTAGGGITWSARPAVALLTR